MVVYMDLLLDTANLGMLAAVAVNNNADMLVVQLTELAMNIVIV